MPDTNPAAPRPASAPAGEETTRGIDSLKPEARAELEAFATHLRDHAGGHPDCRFCNERQCRLRNVSGVRCLRRRHPFSEGCTYPPDAPLAAAAPETCDLCTLGWPIESRRVHTSPPGSAREVLLPCTAVAAPSLEGLDALAEAIRRNLYESADDRGGYAAAHDALAALLARVAQQDRDIEKLRSLWGEATAERKEAGRIVGEWIEAVLAHYPRTMAFDSTAPRLMVDNVLRRLRERADRAAHALGQYGTHRSECDYYLSAARHSCNCGFAAARAASPTTTEPNDA